MGTINDTGLRGNPERSVREQAAEWLAILSDTACTPDERRQFALWVTRANTHVEEFLRISTLTRRLQGAGCWPEVDSNALMSQARSEAKVTPFAASSSGFFSGIGVRAEKRVSRTLWAATASAIAVIAIVLLALQVPRWLTDHRNYATGWGELRSVTLDDGTVVQLNTQSRFRTEFTAAERRVRLIAGEAVFRVAKNPHRPFKVLTDFANVMAVGTQFNVNAQSSQTIVTVLEGSVRVTSPADESEPKDKVPVPAGRREASRKLSSVDKPVPDILLSAGEQVTVAPRLSVRPARVNVAAATAWTVRRLYFENTPLSEAVREFSRYSPQIIRLDDPDLAGRRITGIFDSSDPAALVQFLARYGDTSVAAVGHGWVLGRKDGRSEDK